MRRLLFVFAATISCSVSVYGAEQVPVPLPPPRPLMFQTMIPLHYADKPMRVELPNNSCETAIHAFNVSYPDRVVMGCIGEAYVAGGKAIVGIVLLHVSKNR